VENSQGLDSVIRFAGEGGFENASFREHSSLVSVLADAVATIRSFGGDERGALLARHSRACGRGSAWCSG
jgi:hypothetical protein